MSDLNAFPQYPICGFCQDKGITFDEFNGYCFCACIAGWRRQEADPLDVTEANGARAKLAAIPKVVSR